MKTPTYMETQKLDRLLDTQYTVVDAIEAVAADFVTSYPGALPGTQPAQEVCLIIRSERGVCGDFNETLLHNLEHLPQYGSENGFPSCLRLDINCTPWLKTNQVSLNASMEPAWSRKLKRF